MDLCANEAYAPNNPHANQKVAHCDAQASQAANSAVNTKLGWIDYLTAANTAAIAVITGGETAVLQNLLRAAGGAASGLSVTKGTSVVMWGSIYTTHYQACMGEPSTYIPGATY